MIFGGFVNFVRWVCEYRGFKGYRVRYRDIGRKGIVRVGVE